MKRFIFLALLSAYLAYPGAAEAQFAIPPGLIPKELDGTALMNVTQVRQGRWRLGPIRNAIITRRRGPAPPRFGPTRTMILKTKIYPGKDAVVPNPQPAPRRPGVSFQGPRVQVQVRGGRSC